MKLKPTAVALAAACLCTLAHNAQAVDWKFSGYGTVGAVHSGEKYADFTPSLAQRDGSGYTEEWSTTSDSKLGAQLDAKFSSQWSASAQLLSKYRAGGSYQPELAIGFLRFAPGAGVEFRAGRLAYSAFLVSDYLDIGYSQPWVRPPLEIYNIAFSHVDGMDLTWRTSVGAVGVKAQVLTGKSASTQNAVVLEGKGFAGFNLTADVGDFSTRLSYIHVNKVTVRSDGLDAAFNAVRYYGLPPNALYPGSPAQAANPAEADEYELKDKPASYLSLGATYDPGSWFLTGELGKLSRAGFNPSLTEYYVTGGARLGSFTPYLGFARYRHKDVPPMTSFIIRGIAQSFATRDQQTTTMGLRWDFAKSADLKIQHDRIRNAQGSKGFLQNPQPGFVTGKNYGVTSIAVDFVF